MLKSKRTRAIEIIDQLFPADSLAPMTAHIGRQLLDQAREDCADWRNEPEPVLLRYAELCLARERILDAQVERNQYHGA